MNFSLRKNFSKFRQNIFCIISGIDKIFEKYYTIVIGYINKEKENDMQ